MKESSYAQVCKDRTTEVMSSGLFRADHSLLFFQIVLQLTQSAVVAMVLVCEKSLSLTDIWPFKMTMDIIKNYTRSSLWEDI